MFGSGKQTKKTRGIELIDEVASRFTTMINELDEGMDDCRCEQTSIKEQIESLRCRDSILSSSVNRAEAIASNLRNLISE